MLKGQNDGIAFLAWSPNDALLLSCGREDSPEALVFSTEVSVCGGVVEEVRGWGVKGWCRKDHLSCLCLCVYVCMYMETEFECKDMWPTLLLSMTPSSILSLFLR